MRIFLLLSWDLLETKLPLFFWCWWHCHQSQVTFRLGKLHCWWLDSDIAKWHSEQTGAELGGARGALPPKILPGPPVSPPKLGLFLKSYTDHWQLPVLQNWPLQWPPQMKMSGSAPESKSRSTSAQPGEHAVLWKILVAGKYHNLRRCTLNLTALFGSTWVCVLAREKH